MPSNISTTVFLVDVGFLITGSQDFFEYAFGLVGLMGPVIALVSLQLRGTPQKELRKHRSLAKELLWRCGLRWVSFLDSNNGGAMDACHLFGFVSSLGLDIFLPSQGGLQLMLRHFLDSGTKGSFPPGTRVAPSLVPAISTPPPDR